MNIFYLDSNPRCAAEMHCDIHLNKMIIESCQMMSTALRVLHGKPVKVYKTNPKTGKRKLIQWYEMPGDVIIGNDIVTYQLIAATHINHPCNLWVRKSIHNFAWLYGLAHELNRVRIRDLKKDNHNSLLNFNIALAKLNIEMGLSMLHSYPALAMPVHHIQYKDPVQSYRNYYIAKLRNWAQTSGKEKYTQYTSRSVPTWLQSIN